MRPYGPIIDVILLADLSNSIAILRFEIVKLGHRFGLFCFNSIARGNKLLQILTFDSCKTSPKVYSWDSSFPNKPVDGVSFNSKDSNSFLDRDVFSSIWNLKDDTRQSFFSSLLFSLRRVAVYGTRHHNACSKIVSQVSSQ